jgi:hypothetical protein
VCGSGIGSPSSPVLPSLTLSTFIGIGFIVCHSGGLGAPPQKLLG